MRLLVTSLLLLLMSWSGASAAPAIKFRAYEVRDEQQGGLVLSRIMIPEQWKATSKVVWNYADVSVPVHAMARVESPDGSAWVEFFPYEVFFWLEPVRAQVPLGGRNLGMIHVPNIQLNDAVKHFVLAPYRSKLPGFQVGASRPVKGLAQAFGQGADNGPAMATRIRYTVNGKPAEEEVYAMLGQGNRIPYTGPQGTWYESHRPLMLVHAVGATNGQLDAMLPLLSYIASSVKTDPAWTAHYQKVMAQLSAEFNRNIARGYAQIQAAAALSKSISANNDAMLASMQAQRQAQAQSDASRRAAANAPSSRDGFSEYMRGVETMKDPYWGTSQQSYQQKYHWTDGQGNYRSSNDSGFNPNVGAGGGAGWQKMEPAR